MPPGHGYDHRAEPRPPAYGWRAADGFPPPGEAHRADGQPFPPGPPGFAQPGPGPAGPWPTAYQPQGYPGAEVPPGPYGFPAPQGLAEPPGQTAYQAGYPAANGFAGVGGQPAAHPQYQTWQPYGDQGGYRGPAGHGQTLNGGAYAYVMHEDEPAAPATSRPYADPAPATPSPQSAKPTGEIRAITAGEAAAQSQPAPAAAARPAAARPAAAPRPADEASRESVPDVAPEQMYGPDDPAYGPPGPDWYKRGEERATVTAASGPEAGLEAGPEAGAGEQSAPRGPFEPLRSPDEGYQPASDAENDGHAPGGIQETPEDEALDFLDLDAPTDPEAGTLGQVKDLYVAAGKISTDKLDRHFDQLLERQRKLISDYFNESSGLAAAGPPPQLGFDTAEDLAGLRGGLRDAR
jgi:hypothetical protein